MGVKVIRCSRILSRSGANFTTTCTSGCGQPTCLPAVCVGAVRKVPGKPVEDEVRMRRFGNRDASHPSFCRGCSPSVRAPEDASGASCHKPDTSIQPTFPYQGYAWLLCSCTILSVLHILVPSLFFSSDVWKFADVPFPQAFSLPAAVAAARGFSGSCPGHLGSSRRKDNFLMSHRVQ